jgi:hypothetical protein
VCRNTVSGTTCNQAPACAVSALCQVVRSCHIPAAGLLSALFGNRLAHVTTACVHPHATRTHRTLIDRWPLRPWHGEPTRALQPGCLGLSCTKPMNRVHRLQHPCWKRPGRCTTLLSNRHHRVDHQSPGPLSLPEPAPVQPVHLHHCKGTPVDLVAGDSTLLQHPEVEQATSAVPKSLAADAAAATVWRVWHQHLGKQRLTRLCPPHTAAASKLSLGVHAFYQGRTLQPVATGPRAAAATPHACNQELYLPVPRLLRSSTSSLCAATVQHSCHPCSSSLP